MNNLLKTTFAVGIIWIAISGSAFPQTNDSLTIQYISAVEAQKDFRIMYDLIHSYHPDPFKFTREAELESSKNIILEDLTDSISESEMHIIIRQYLRQIRCGHTVAQPSQKWYADHVKHAKFLPLKVLMQNEKFYVDTCMGAKLPVKSGTEIISINGIPSDKILEDMRAIQPQDGEADKFVNHQIEKNFSTYFVFLYGWDTEYSIVFKIGNETEIVQTLPGLKSGSAKVDESRKVPSYLSHTDTAASMNGAVLYRFNDRQDLFYLDITTFANSGYKKFYKKGFDVLKDRQDASLIIDIRDNGGGYFPNTNKLLQYIGDSTIHFTFQRPRTKPEKHPNIKMGFFSRITKSAFSLLKDPYKVTSVQDVSKLK